MLTLLGECYYISEHLIMITVARQPDLGIRTAGERCKQIEMYVLKDKDQASRSSVGARGAA